jgi:predicted phage terminase large subunit-like protein
MTSSSQRTLSETRRQAANSWFFGTLLSRLNNKEQGTIIIVMQRLHQEDLVGEATDREAWEILSLPAIAIEDEHYEYKSLFGGLEFTRKVGEALHPERDTVETYRKIRETVGEYNFQSQYQQSPTSREGAIVKREWLRYYEPANMPADFEWILQSWDTACKIGETNDYSVCTTWKVVGMNFYLVEDLRERLTYPQLKRAASEHFRKHQPWTVLIEDQASGIALIQELRNEGVYCIDAYKPAPGSDKTTRFSAQSIKFEAGRVFLPIRAPWLDEYIGEITGFPGAKYDDQVDSTSQALERLSPMAQSAVPLVGGFRYIDSSRYPRDSW